VRKKKLREHLDREQLGIETDTQLDVHDLIEGLVSRRTGVIVDLAAASREPTEPHLPLVWRARIANHAFAEEAEDNHAACSGKGFTTRAAWMSCLGEAVERYSAGRWSPDELVPATRAELSGPTVDPRELVLYEPELYEHLPYASYTDDTRLPWLTGWSLISDAEIWLPAIAALMEFTVGDPSEFLFPITSNGLAAGPTLRDAVTSAICEVLERDAFMITWSNQLPARVLDGAAHRDADVRDLVLGYRRRGVRLELFELPTDHPVSVIMGVAFQEGGFGGPAATVGLGADVVPARAARQAVLEVGQVRPAFRERARGRDAERIAELVADPQKVTTLEDHSLLYADATMVSAFDFLHGRHCSWEELESEAAVAVPRSGELDLLLDHFGSVGQDVIYVNLTSPDVEPLGLFTARAVLPGYQPIWFGHHEQRLGGTRMFELPHRLGLRAQPSTTATLNPLPHPLA